jgi:hypothetical protein
MAALPMPAGRGAFRLRSVRCERLAECRSQALRRLPTSCVGCSRPLDARAPIVDADLVADRHAASAANLADHLALRSHDLRPLQVRLARLGVSSLGRAEAHVRTPVAAALRACDALAALALRVGAPTGDRCRTLAARR